MPILIIFMAGMMAPLTRNQKLAMLFNKPSWPATYDRRMMQLLAEQTNNIPTLASRHLHSYAQKCVRDDGA